MVKELSSRDLMVGDIIFARVKGTHGRQCMVTEILKEKIKVLDIETREEEITEAKNCISISVTSDLLSNVLKFEKHQISKLINPGTNKRQEINEWIKVISDPENSNYSFILTIPAKENPNDPWMLEVIKAGEGDNKKISVPIIYLHELQNQVYFLTKLVLC